MRALAVLGLGLAMIASPAGAEVDLTALRWVKELQRAEELIAAAIETGDGEELQTQIYALAHLMGRKGELEPMPVPGRLGCIMAAQALANVARDLASQTPARALVEARADAKIFRRRIVDCERAAGRAVPRMLPL